MENLINKKAELIIKREFDAPREIVFDAFADADALAEWWGPPGVPITVLKFDFRTNGIFHYKTDMQGQTAYGRFVYGQIKKPDVLEFVSSFSDENGGLTRAPFSDKFPLEIFNHLDFTEQDGKTTITLSGYPINATEEELQFFSQMSAGMQQGFAGTFNQLENYLKAKFKLKNQNKTNHKARTSSYLNFPGTTEQAFIFYRSVFGTEFIGNGIQHFGDIPQDSDHPPIPDNIKHMVLHVELPILGGHILMATDAPKELGMTLTQGNNMHICLEPETKTETKKLFDALSKDGKIVMPLADMFFGAYFGECTDKFGINWMFNCIEKK
jgi:uncharacterized glyoxalase superfamily protein PhnB/uncharacterized protein YndB with AHSA1/START domain